MIEKDALLDLASGWRAPEDEGAFERYLKRLKKFATEASEREYRDFIVELRNRGKSSKADYMVTVYPALRLYIARFGEAPGRLLAGFMEASSAGEEDDEAHYLARLVQAAPKDRIVEWFDLLN